MEVLQSNRLMKIEAILRFFAMLTLLLAAIIMGTDKQIRVYFGAYKEKIDFKKAYIFQISMYVYSVGAGYNLLQLVRCLAFTNYEGEKPSSDHILIKWIYFMLDQVGVYVVFSIACASLEIGVLGINGNDEVEWMKVCNKYGRFCFQFGGSIVCAIIASITFAIISSLSTFNLFRWYSPYFFCLKPTFEEII